MRVHTRVCACVCVYMYICPSAHGFGAVDRFPPLGTAQAQAMGPRFMGVSCLFSFGLHCHRLLCTDMLDFYVLTLYLGFC